MSLPVGGRHAASALACTTVGILPAALFSSLAPLIRGELGFDARWIGLGVAVFFTASALSSVPGGRLADSLGSRNALWLGVAVSAAALIGLAGLARDVWGLALFLAVGGVANAVTQPAANLALARGVPPRRRGLAFGFKQAAIPAGMALGGFAVPLVGLTLGWRWAFAGAAGLTLLAAALPRATSPSSVQTGGHRHRLSPIPTSLWLLTAGIGLGSAAANAMGAYLVASTIAAGWSPGPAGAVLGAGSVLGILARLTVGWISDRMTADHLRFVATMMVAGSFGFAALAYSRVPLLLAIGVAVSFAAGWGYNGLFLYAVVRLHPDTPAAATSVTQLGAFGGPVAGPPLFGVIATGWSYGTAWLTLAVISCLAAVFVHLGRRRITQERAG